MTLRDQASGPEVARRRDRALAASEREMAEAVGRAVRQFLRRCQQAVTPASLTAASGSSVPRPVHLFTLGQAAGWWAESLSEHVTGEVESVWRAGYFDTRDGELLRSSLSGADVFLASVTDRLSRTATPTIPEQAMNTARVALSDEMARGSTVRTMSRRLATDLGWDADATFYRERLDDLDGQVDAILDPIGPPGHPAREAARLNDPVVREIQAQRAEARKRIDRTESEWQVRSERIARTETTGAYNAGSLQAAHDEGAGVKIWLATADSRTRREHLTASGQCVPVDSDFRVGGRSLTMPADPSGPPGLTINCRCTMVFARSCEDGARRFSDVDDVIEEERQRREEEDGTPITGTDPEAPPPIEAAEFRPVERDYDSREEWGQRNWSGTEWDEEEQRALAYYQRSGYEGGNSDLRSGAPLDENTRWMVDETDRAIQRAAPIPENVVAYRGIQGDFAAQVKGGMTEWTDDGYLSTSLDREVAVGDFAARGLLMEVRVPAGTRGLYMNANPKARMSVREEQELLLGRGQRLRVVERHDDRVVVDIIGQDPADLG